MENERGVSDFVKYFQYCCSLEADKSRKNLYRKTAVICAASCLATANITDPIEQVKYLHRKFLHSRPILKWIPWAWLAHCVEKKLISELPNEDWILEVYIEGMQLEGNQELASLFIEMKKHH
jgi:hypothetical protein